MIRYADEKDFEAVRKHDKHISEVELTNAIRAKRVLVIHHNNHFVGWLRYNQFWDEIPFMNMLYVLEEYRGHGYGGRLLDFWEKEMADCGFGNVSFSQPKLATINFCVILGGGGLFKKKR